MPLQGKLRITSVPWPLSSPWCVFAKGSSSHGGPSASPLSTVVGNVGIPRHNTGLTETSLGAEPANMYLKIFLGPHVCIFMVKMYFLLVLHNYQKGRWDVSSFCGERNGNSRDVKSKAIQLICGKAKIWIRICLILDLILGLPCAGKQKGGSNYEMTGIYLQRDKESFQPAEAQLGLGKQCHLVAAWEQSERGGKSIFFDWTGDHFLLLALRHFSWMGLC